MGAVHTLSKEWRTQFGKSYQGLIGKSEFSGFDLH